MNRKQIIVLVLALLAGFLLRAALVMGAGYKQDVLTLKVWSQTAATYGVHCVYDKTDCDYPPGYLYVLKAVGLFYGNFSPDFNKDTYLANFLVKLPPVLADLLIAGAVFGWLLRRRRSYRFSLLMMSAVVFNPALIYNSAYWGQLDSVPALLGLLGVMALAPAPDGAGRGRGGTWLAWSLLALAVLVKLQMIVILPLFVFAAWRKNGFNELLAGCCASFMTVVAALAPFFYFHQIGQVIEKVLGLIGKYAFLSLNAYNFWWFLLGRDARWVVDTRLIWNFITYRELGNVLLLAFLALLLWHLFKNEKDETVLFLGGGLAIFAFFMLAAEMHERYIVPALAFLPLAAASRRDLKIIYGVLSLTTFFNLVITLARVYPETFPRTAAFWGATPLDRLLAAANVAVLAYFTWLFLKEAERKYLVPLLAAAVLLFSGRFAIELLPPRPAYLSDLPPVYSEQQWGKLRTDRSVDGRQLAVHRFIYRRGLGTHANSTIIYDLHGRYRCLEGAVGLDDEANRGSNQVEFKIYADNRPVYQSGIMRGVRDPKAFFLPLARAKELKLVVTDGGDGINCDHADWLGLKVF
ncbi:MAG: NPCBM/NEW2 domain-containing protein [Candidatus Saganbacteria bacterium]|nr:NPCBM/NEW2 domain-containing protein [Candidatus Saganbacteria bacterium]